MTCTPAVWLSLRYSQSKFSTSLIEIDLFTKRREYARAGLANYWVVDPEAPRTIAYRRRGADMVATVDAAGDAPFAVQEPLTVTFAPSDLLREETVGPIP